MLAPEVLPDVDLHDVFDLGLLCHGDVASNSRSANQHHERQLKHLAVIKQETHLGQGARVALDDLWIPQIYRRVVNQAGRLQILLRVHLDMIDFETGVGAIKLVLRATPALQMIDALARQRRI